MTGAEKILETVGRERADFNEMCALYREWNEKINVISRKDIDCIFEHHVLHSLCIAAYLKDRKPEVLAQWKGGPEVAHAAESKQASVLDLGCGGGFPGIPLAFCFPDVQFTLCDSIAKKITVASSVAASLGLTNVNFINGRVEEQAGKWDWVVSRAVAPLDKLLDWTAGKFDKGIICLKGGDLKAETDACLCPKMTRRLARYGLKSPALDSWSIFETLRDEYYQEKLIIGLNW